MSETVEMEQLADTIVTAVAAYTEEVSVAIRKATIATAQAIVTDIETGAPQHWSAAYRKSFKYVTEESEGRITCTVHSPKYYRRIHLLEHGHAFRNGGRARAFPHFNPAADKNMAVFEERAEEIVRSGGEQ